MLSECIVTHVIIRKTILSTAEVRRGAVISAAMTVFATSGYLGTPVTQVAKRAKISPAYVFKLFPCKEELFVAALERTFELVLAALEKGADDSAEQTPEALLFAMGWAYAALIADRKLLLMQVHAQSAMNVPKIAKCFRSGLKNIIHFVKHRSNAPDDLVQRFIAYGQLCHLITITDLDKDTSASASILTNGIRHV